MIEKLKQYRSSIVPYENNLLEDACDRHPEGDILFEKLSSFTNAGKHVRGSLYLAATQWWRDLDDDDYRVAASIELLHSAMLIQDDIMDDDDRRRGQPAVHAFFRSHQDDIIADGVAICCSDLLIFAATKALADIDGGLASIASEAVQQVAIGQIQDITGNTIVDDTEPSRDDIISMYKAKTGRYTFTLPMELAEERANEQGAISPELGGLLGVVFQLRDDELNIYGDSSETGKPTMSDVEEDKQTVLRSLLLERYPDMARYFGSSLDDEDKTVLLDGFEGVREKHRTLKEQYLHRVRQRVADSEIPSGAKDDLRSLAKFVATRDA